MSYIGKTFRLFNYDNSLLEEFVVKYHKTATKTVIHESTTSFYTEDLVSENGSGWYRIDTFGKVFPKEQIMKPCTKHGVTKQRSK